MHSLRTTRALYGWTVLLTFLFGLFTPAISQAVARANPPGASAWITEICSASGTRHVMVIDDAAPASAPGVPDMSHCDLCCPHQPVSMAPPPGSTPLLVLVPERDSCPPLFYHAPRPQHAWTPVQSRGPPSHLS